MSYNLQLVTKFTTTHYWVVVPEESRKTASDIPFLNNRFIPCEHDTGIDISTAYFRLLDFNLVDTPTWNNIRTAVSTHNVLPIATALSSNDQLTSITFTWVKCMRDLSNYNPPYDDLTDACSTLDPEQLDNYEVQTVLFTFFNLLAAISTTEIHESVSLELPEPPNWTSRQFENLGPKFLMRFGDFPN